MILGITTIIGRYNIGTIINRRNIPALWKYMLHYLWVKYHDILNLPWNGSVMRQKMAQLLMMVETRWMVLGCSLHAFLSCIFEMRIEANKQK